MLTPSVEAPRLLVVQSPEPHVAASFSPDGLANFAGVYVATGDVLQYSPFGGDVFTETFSFSAPDNTGAGPGCLASDGDQRAFSKGDIDVLVAGPDGSIFATPRPPAYASALVTIGLRGSELNPPNAVMIVKSAPSGAVGTADVSCNYVFEPPGTGVTDKSSLAFDATFVRSANGFFHRTVFVAWQDGGTTSPTSGVVRPAESWVQAIPVDPKTGAFQPLEESPRSVPSPIYGSKAIAPGATVPFFRGPCTSSLKPGDTFIDDVGRGNLWSNGTASTLPNQTAPLYYAYSNVLGVAESEGVRTRRIYVDRLDHPHEFISCVDQFDADVIASQGHVEEHDPEMVVDPVTDTVGLVYARPVSRGIFAGRERITLAGSDSHGTNWTYTDVDPADDGADATQPAIALSNFTSDVIDRVFSGVIMVTWYKDAGNNHVNRVGRAFIPTTSHGWVPVTTVFNISSAPFVPMVGPWDQTSNRGVYEFQGVAHLPGYAPPGVSAAGGGWIGVWMQPFRNPDDPIDADQGVFWTRWP